MPDIAIQECGELEAVLAFSFMNDIPVTADLTGGQVLEYDVKEINKKVVQTLTAYGIKPACGLSAQDFINAPYKGIGFMAIERDFIVR